MLSAVGCAGAAAASRVALAPKTRQAMTTIAAVTLRRKPGEVGITKSRPVMHNESAIVHDATHKKMQKE